MSTHSTTKKTFLFLWSQSSETKPQRPLYLLPLSQRRQSDLRLRGAASHTRCSPAASLRRSLKRVSASAAAQLADAAAGSGHLTTLRLSSVSLLTLTLPVVSNLLCEPRDYAFCGDPTRQGSHALVRGTPAHSRVRGTLCLFERSGAALELSSLPHIWFAFRCDALAPTHSWHLCGFTANAGNQRQEKASCPF